jgi:transcriptional regulator with XRE-family HTH domain
MRLPKVGPQQMTWDAGNAADGRNPLSGYLSPLRDSPPLDAEFPSDQSPETTASGRAQQVHSGEASGHPTTLSDPKPIGKPSMFETAQYLCRETEQRLWHTNGMTIGERIAAARTKAGLSQQDVARALGVGRSAVNQWESGTTKPSITRRAQLAVLLDMRITDLIPGMPVDEITEAIAQIIRAVPPDKQAGLVLMIEHTARLLADPPPDPPPDSPAPRRTRKKQHS